MTDRYSFEQPTEQSFMAHLLVRILLGSIFLLYAFAKFAGMQFSHLRLDMNIRDMDGIALVWYFFGFSKVYGLFIAFGQLVAAILTIWTKTFRLGLPVYFSIALNIAVLDWSYGFPLPATLLATALAVTSAAMIGMERHQYLKLLERGK